VHTCCTAISDLRRRNERLCDGTAGETEGRAVFAKFAATLLLATGKTGRRRGADMGPRIQVSAPASKVAVVDAHRTRVGGDRPGR